MGWTECGHCAYFDFDIARQRFQKYDDDDPQGLGGVDRVWTLCALPALRSRKSSTAKAGVCETRLRKMMMMMTIHVLKVNDL